jgi:excisionase family DNA binding protein
LPHTGSMAAQRTAEFIGTTEAARRLGVCQRTIWRWIASGKVQATKPVGLREWVVATSSLPKRPNADETSP